MSVIKPAQSLSQAGIRLTRPVFMRFHAISATAQLNRLSPFDSVWVAMEPADTDVYRSALAPTCWKLLLA
jgi:hypothetical protein